MSHWDDNRPGPDVDTSVDPLDHIDEWADLALDYIDGTVAPTDVARVERHLADCPACFSRLERQREMASGLASISPVDAPEGLEYRILGELLFPSQVPPIQPEPAKAPIVSLWQRRLRAWVPAAAAVAAVLVGIVAYGLLRTADNQQAADLFTTTGPTAAAAVAAAPQDDTGAAQDSGQVETATTVAAATETTTNDAGGSDGTDMTLASSDTPPATITSRSAMVEAMKTSTGPLYLALAPKEVAAGDRRAGNTSASDTSSDTGATSDPSGAGDSTSTDSTGYVSEDWIEQTVQQIAQFTELLPLPESAITTEPVFAAYLDHDHVSAFIDLMLAIANTVRCDVSMQALPDPGSQMATMIEGHKGDLPALLSHVIPQPAPVRYSFTTSTLASSSNTSEEEASLDQDGTHVLTIVFVRR